MCRSRFRRASNWSKHLLELPTWKEGTSPFRGKDLFHANDADSRAAFAAKHTHAHARRPRECDRPFAPNLETSRACPAPRPGGRVDMRPRRETRRTSRTKTRATTAEPAIFAWRRRGQRRGGRACDAETTPDDATDTKPDEDDNSRQVRGSARASRHDPFPNARLLLSFRYFQCRFSRRGAFRRGRPRSVSAPRVVECAAPPVHGRARADPERPPPAFPAFRVDVRPLDAGSSRQPNVPGLFRVDSADSRS